MAKTEFKKTKFACYASYFTMSSVFCVPPMLFVTFRESYGISYTLLGTLVLINFFTQLSVDLIFTFFSRYFSIPKTVRTMPLLTALGLVLYAVIPQVFPQFAYGGLVIGTVLFSVSAGLSEVLLSPIIAAIPSDNPKRDMSFLHSLYAFGVFSMVTISTLFLKVFGRENWMYLIIFLAMLPLIPAVLFATSKFPDISDSTPETSVAKTGKRSLGLALCLGCIFFGSCAENVMSNWISSYMEKALQIDKAIGDIFGVAMFAILLGLMRIWYARFGKNIIRVLLFGMVGASACYLTIALSNNPFIGFISCAVTGLFTAMLWPGTLIMMEENIPGAGVTAFALMAAGGDLGASVAPQLLGLTADSIATAPLAETLGSSLGISAEQVGLKAGMLVCAIFPIMGIITVLLAAGHFKKSKR